MIRLLAAAAAASLAAGPAGAFRVVPGSFTASPATVMLTRSITVGVELEEAGPEGAEAMEVELEPRPAIVRLLAAEPPPPFTCTSTGRTRGRWVYEALAPGTITFRLRASLITCTRSETTRLEDTTAPVSITPLPIWSRLALEPRHLAPGEALTLTLSLRNDSLETAVLPPPRAAPELFGHARMPAEPAGEAQVDPPESLRAGRIVLPPGVPVQIRWRFRMRDPGEAKFVVTGAGLLVTSPGVLVRAAPVLEVTLDPFDEARAEGQTLVVRGSLRAGGGAGIAGAEPFIVWSPPGAARLLSIPPGPVALEPGGTAPWRAELELSHAGALEVSVTAAGREADTGRPLAAAAPPHRLAVLPPASLRLTLSVAGTPVFVGDRVPLSVIVENRGAAAAANMTPLVLIKRGAGEVLTLSPLFQSVPAGGQATFRGGLVPRAAGPVSFAAQVTGRAALGGEWTTAVSEPATVTAYEVPRLEVAPDTVALRAGEAGTVRLHVRNVSRDALTLTAASLAGASGAADAPVLRPVRFPLALAPGAGGTLAAAVRAPAGGKPAWIDAALTLGGTIDGPGLRFTLPGGQRPVALAYPDATQVLWAEPAVFAPPRDPALAVAWTLSAAGRMGVVIATPAGAVVRTLVPPSVRGAGMHEVTWDGTLNGPAAGLRAGSGALAVPGKYLVRLTGAGWNVDHPFELVRP